MGGQPVDMEPPAANDGQLPKTRTAQAAKVSNAMRMPCVRHWRVATVGAELIANFFFECSLAASQAARIPTITALRGLQVASALRT